MRKLLCIALSALLLLAAMPALAADIGVTVNGEEIYFDQPPVVQNGRTLVPIRGVFEALGCTVRWNGANQQITIANGNDEIICWLGNDRYEKRRNGSLESEGQFDVAPQAMNGRTLVPVRAISEAFDCDVEWNGDTSTVVINDADTIKIGIVQIVDHPSLNAANKGFVDAVNDSGLKVYFEQKNAMNDVTVAEAAVQEFVSDGKDLIYALSAPAALTASSITNDIPILFGAVTQPVEAGLVQSLEHPGGNISGVMDIMPDIPDGGGDFTSYKIDYYHLGYMAGKMAVRYLTGQVNSVGDMPVEQLSGEEVDEIVDFEAASAQGVTPNIGFYVPGM